MDEEKVCALIRYALFVSALVIDCRARRAGQNGFARNGWKREWQEIIVGHGERGGRDGGRDPHRARPVRQDHRARLCRDAAKGQILEPRAARLPGHARQSKNVIDVGVSNRILRSISALRPRSPASNHPVHRE